MSAPAAITGTFADLKTVKTRSVIQLVIECPIELGETVVRAFGFPQPGKEVPVAVARLVETVAEKERRRWSDLLPAQQAGIRCNELAFQLFLSERGEEGEDAAAAVRSICGVNSRAEIRADQESGRRWHDLEIEYQNWLHARDPGLASSGAAA